MAAPFLQRVQRAVTALRGREQPRTRSNFDWRPSNRVTQVSAQTGAPLNVALMRRRSRTLAETDAYFGAAIRALETNLVGAEIVASSTHPDASTQESLAGSYADFAKVADFDGQTNLGGLQAALVADMIRDGEALALLKNTPAGLRIQRLPVEFLDESKSGNVGDAGAYIFEGVERDASGAKVAHWIFPTDPNNPMAASVESVRVPFDDVIHMFDAKRPGQNRGVPWGASAIDRSSEISQTESALLASNKVAATNCGFIYDDFGATGVPFGEGQQDGDTRTVTLEPATMQRLGPGQKVVFNTPAQSAQGVEFLASQLRAVASSFGVPAFFIDSDYSRANFSSLRASLVTYAARLDQIVHTILVPQMLDRIWRRWLTTEILRGAIQADNFESAPQEWLGVEWFPPAPPVADEIKAAQADALQIKSGLKSRSQAIRERGYAPEVLDKERAADAERERALGVQDNAAGDPEGDSNSAD